MINVTNIVIISSIHKRSTCVIKGRWYAQRIYMQYRRQATITKRSINSVDDRQQP